MNSENPLRLFWHGIHVGAWSQGFAGFDSVRPHWILLAVGCVPVFLALLVPPVVLAQAYSAELTGHITDAQGGVIIGADVKATEQTRETAYGTV